LDAGKFKIAGWVARLASGRADLEIGSTAKVNRGVERGEAIIANIDHLDGRLLEPKLNPHQLTFYDELKLAQLSDKDPELSNQLIDLAEKALDKGPYSVVQKSTIAPSGDPHDYWHPAPYWWPDPAKDDGLPYIRRDGFRVPGTVLNDPESGQYDRTRLQSMFDDTTILALAGTVSGQMKFSAHAAELVRAWFTNPETRMNPHLDYAQVRRGHNGDRGTKDGIIEFKDLYFFLDAVRLLKRNGALKEDDITAFEQWLTEYAKWLETSHSGKLELTANNNHGTFYEVQLLAIATFIGNARLAAGVRNRAKIRLITQINSDGKQPHELSRTKPRHYASFGLLGWTILARQLSTIGVDIWEVRAGGNGRIRRALEWLAAAEEKPSWTVWENEDFPTDRLLPLWDTLEFRFNSTTVSAAGREFKRVPIMKPDYGIAPFWMLARN
jgi:hypothetical protein